MFSMNEVVVTIFVCAIKIIICEYIININNEYA